MEPAPSRIHLRRWPVGSPDALVRGRVSRSSLGQWCFGTESLGKPYAPSDNPEKAIGHESQIEPWLALHNPSACLRQKPTGVVTTAPMNLAERKDHSASSQYVGWTARPCSLRLPVAGEAFLLTSPFIERDYRILGIGGPYCTVRRLTGTRSGCEVVWNSRFRTVPQNW